MPSSLLPSRSARIAVFISARIFSFISSRRSLTLARNFLRLVEAGFLGMYRQPLYRLGRVQDPCMQIIGESLLDSGADELARLGVAAQEYHAVYIGRLRRAASAQTPRSLAVAFDQHFHFPPDEAAIAMEGNRRLHFHQPGAARAHRPR